MTPPAHQAVIDATRQAPAAAEPARGLLRRLRLQQGDLVALTDIWVLLAVFWTAKLLLNLDEAVAVFAVATFALTVTPNPQRRRLTSSALDDTGAIARKVGIAYVIASAASVFGVGDTGILLTVAAATAPALLGGRALSYAAERSLRRRVRAKALVVGAGIISRRVVETLKEHDEYGLDVVGAVDDDARFSAAELGTRVVGGIKDVPELISTHSVEVVIVAFSAGDQAPLVNTIRAAQASGATVWVVPRFFELGLASPSSDHLWGLPVIRLATPATLRPQWIAKRIFDVAVSTVALVVAAPLLALVGLAIALESGRPVLFRQRRIGNSGEPFDMLKFRSMIAVDTTRSETEWCNSAEARITKVGRVIRATGIDELPQLLNVLKGEMSLVGPRPERPHFVAEFSARYPAYAARHRLPVGLTGWSQVNGLRGDTSIEERACFDNYYIENWSLGQDLKIIMRTAFAVFRNGEGGGEDRKGLGG